MEDSSAPVTAVHLLTCVHGMWGNPGHLEHLAKVMKETHEKAVEDGDVQLEVLIAETNRDAHTYDGVDWGAERVVQEIKERITSIEAGNNKKVTRFSITGYSLGGLLARYVVGVLNHQGLFDTIVPVNFITIATPNIGLLRYPGVWSYLFNKLGPILLSRTGQHFYAKDNWSDGKSLLEAMSEPGSVFYDGIVKFKHITTYANVVNDITVPFITAAAEPFDPFVAHADNGIEIALDEKYSPVIKSYTLPSEASSPLRKKPPRSLWRRVVDWWNAPSRLPPWMQRVKFPFNILLYLLLPILVPAVIVLIIFNLAMNSFRSQKRIKLMEAEGKSSRSQLVTFVRAVERELEDAVVDFIEDTAGEADPIQPLESTPTKPVDDADRSTEPGRRNAIIYTVSEDPYSQYKSSASTNKNQPILSDVQKRILKNFNTLPKLEKKYVFLDGLRSSHTCIVCRDLKSFEFQRRGEGVLRYLADHFEL